MPEESKALIKRHAESITQNTAANIITPYIVNGVPAMTGWIVAHLASVQGWALPWVILLFLAAFALTTFGVNQIRKLRSAPVRGNEDECETALISHDDCERNIRNLESRISRLQRNDQTQGIQISARDGQIEQLKTEIAGFGWLREIAAWQSTCVEQYIGTRCWIRNHSLIEEPLFIDFLFSLESSAVYKLSATGVSGSIRMDNRRLGAALPTNYPPKIEGNQMQGVEIGKTGLLTITQPLTRADAVFILNGGGDFFFDGLFIELEAVPAIEQPIKLSPNDTVSNQMLRDAYPKLDIQFNRATYSYVIDRQNENPSSYDYAITLDVTIENKRKTKIDIDSVQVSLVSTSRPPFHLQPDRGEIYEKRFIENGSSRGMGKQLKNLGNYSLSIIGRGKVWGCFQFSLENAALDALQDTTASLALTDKYGEHHVGNHDITHI